jgi:hypothetical protein
MTLRFLLPLCAAMLINLGAADLDDLGVITPKHALIIEKDTTRGDWDHFKVEVLPTVPPTNKVSFSVTNEIVTLSHFGAVSSGPSVLAVQSVTKDGTKSPIKLYRIEIRRAAPPAPSVRLIELLTDGPVAVELETKVEQIKKAQRVPYPAIPTRIAGTNIELRHLPVGIINPTITNSVIPQGTNRVYAEELDRMADFHEKAVKNRRNQF